MDDVLIVGAGPTGLMAAVWLAACGVRARVVDPKPGPTPETRAVTLQARTLEQWAMLGLAETALARGHRANGTDVWVEGRVAARLALGEVGQGLSPYQFVLLLPQSETEAILHDRLRELGGKVEWGTRVTKIEGNRAWLMKEGTPEGSEEDSRGSQTPGSVAQSIDPGVVAEFRFILGCDGASSAVRKATGLGFPGGTYEGRFFVADVDAVGGVVPKEINVAFLSDRFFAFFPLREPNRYRMVGLVRKDEPTEEDMRQEAETRMGTRISRVRWFSVYRVHHRVVERFREGPVFLLGDAAHVHSPVGGQGMNTGLGDAMNLAWKLAEVLKHGADERLLDSYEAERRPFALSLVRTTDRAFELAVRDAAFARLVRTRLLPLGLATALKAPAFRRLAFRTVSQTRITYRHGPLARGPRSGDRLPPFPNDGARPDRWRLLVPKETPEARRWCETRGIDLVAAPMHGAAFLVRPDGYLGLTAALFDPAEFDRYLRHVIGRPF